MARLSQAEPRPGIPPGSPMRVTGTQALGPSFIAFPGAFKGAGLEVEQLELKPVPISNASLGRRQLNMLR